MGYSPWGHKESDTNEQLSTCKKKKKKSKGKTEKKKKKPTETDCSNVAEYNVKIHKSVAFFYSSDHVEFEIKCNAIHISITKIKYLDISNKICIRAIWGKLQNSGEQNKK